MRRQLLPAIMMMVVFTLLLGIGYPLVVTGIAADGGRDLIARLGGTNSTFTGSAWDWLTAP